MRILNRLPYAAEPTTVTVHRGWPARVKPYQIITWVSLSGGGMLEWNPKTPRFPAVLDPGSNHNFSIGQGQLIQWAGIRPELLRGQGAVRDRGERIPLHAAHLWLHANQPGTREVRQDREPYRLRVHEGIAIYPDDRAPRLPILGLRAITRNGLQLMIDGDRRLVWLRTPDWRAKLLRCLA